MVTVRNTDAVSEPGLKVYAFNGSTYTNFSVKTDAQGRAVFTLPDGNYRFRADKDSKQYWSGESNHCVIPGCVQANITLPGEVAAVTRTITYTYDSLSRLTAADYTLAGAGSTGEYFHYTYDNAGNRLTEEKKTSPTAQPQTTAYTYDDANRMTFAGGVAYAWDDNGNLLSDGANTYTYNHSNRLITVSGPSSVISFTYNGMGVERDGPAERMHAGRRPLRVVGDSQKRR